jgi:type IV pilus assembly protein PilE
MICTVQETNMIGHQRGVTLMELMVVMVIISILAAIAYPSYREQVRRSNRTEAKVALEQSAQSLEKCFTRYMSYSNANCAAANQFADGGGFATPHGDYRVTGTIGAAAFTLTAAPQGGQTSDAECMNFTLTETGIRGISGSGNRERCW